MLTLHGTGDTMVIYNGGSFLGTPYPSAPETIGFWSRFNGCSSQSLSDFTLANTFDLETKLPGSETQLFTANGCPSGVSVEHLKIIDGGHIPAFYYNKTAQKVIEFFKRHTKSI